MSMCIAPRLPPKTLKPLEERLLNDHEWSLMSLVGMAKAGNTLEDISQVIPFRSSECTRTTRCCGVCTRRCISRCMQDCLNRLYMWRNIYESTPEQDRDKLPLNIRMIVNQTFSEREQLSWAVGEIISSNTNTALKKYMQEAGLMWQENPYKLDYEPRVSINPKTGQREVDPETGRIKFLEWPESGLCPYCVPRNTLDRRFGARADP